MTQPAPPPPDPNSQPTWKDLAAFTSEQAKETRNVIDYWLKLAAWLLGVVLLFAVAVAVAVAVVGVVGWKTIGDAKATAQAEAEKEAREEVRALLQEGPMKQLVNDTAKDLLAKGTFRQTTEDAVRAQLPDAIRAEDDDDHPLTYGIAVGADGSVGVNETGVYEDGDTSPVFNCFQVANGAFSFYYAWNGPSPITYNPTPVPPAGGLFSPNITGENSNWFAWWLIAYSEGTIAGLQAQMGIPPAAPGFPGSWGINW